MRWQAHPVLAVCTTLGLWAAWALPVAQLAPNRLLSGEPVFLSALLPGWAGWMVLPLIVLVFSPTKATASMPPVSETGGLMDRWHRVATLLLMAGLLAGLFWLVGRYAQQVTLTESRLARTSLGAGFWSILALAWLASLDAAQHLTRSAVLRHVLMAVVALPFVTLLVLGVGHDLSILKEYANRDDVFWTAVRRHLQIVAVATLPSVLLALPLAWACSRFTRLRQAVFPLLNIIQTIPSIALFGLFMAPLAWLALRFPALSQADISGVGLAPAVLALVLYSLLPITRSALAGLDQVPEATQTAARAMGMSAGQIFWRVELPLALPVLLPGLRTAVVQTIGLAAVTALVGAGGLGSLMFDGLFSAANDLVLLGVLPIVLLAMLVDALFKAAISFTRPATVLDGAPPVAQLADAGRYTA